MAIFCKCLNWVSYYVFQRLKHVLQIHQDLVNQTSTVWDLAIACILTKVTEAVEIRLDFRYPACQFDAHVSLVHLDCVQSNMPSNRVILKMKTYITLLF